MFSVPVANRSVLSSEDSVGLKILKRLLPLLVVNNVRKRLAKNRRLERSQTTRKRRRGGRTWSQRKKGDLNREHFRWWRLIHTADVDNVQSRNGQVMYMHVFAIFLIKLNDIVLVCIYFLGFFSHIFLHLSRLLFLLVFRARV